jgi:hypothetical protein
MMRKIVMQQMRRVTFVVAATVILSGFAAAYDRDDDDYYRHGNAAQTREYGYQNGYNDGLHKGRHEGKENDPYDFRSREWQNADHGYKSWMGPFDLFREGYRNGYRAGFEEGFQSVRNRDYRDGDHDGDRWHGEDVGYRSPAKDIGFQDGARVAQQDMMNGKPFNPYPRSGYADADHGYRNNYGSKSEYQAEYTNAYRAGYQSVFRRRY